MIADQYYLNGDYARSVGFCTKGIKIAQDSLFRSAEANLRFNLKTPDAGQLTIPYLVETGNYREALKVRK